MKLATHLVNAFFHSQQSKAFVFRVQVKSGTVIKKAPELRHSHAPLPILRGFLGVFEFLFATPVRIAR